MAHSLTAKKRIRQNVVRRARNRARKRQLHLKVRAFGEAVRAGKPEESATALKAAIKTIDKVASKRTIHKNTAARKKSRLQKQLNALKAEKA